MDKGHLKLQDARFQDNRKPVKRALEHLENIESYEFNWNLGQNQFYGKDYGFVGQELEKTNPELVQYQGNDGERHIRLESMVAILWQQNKELLKRIKKLESKL